MKYREYLEEVKNKNGTVSICEFARMQQLSRKTATKVKDFYKGSITYFNPTVTKNKKINYGKKSFTEEEEVVEESPFDFNPNKEHYFAVFVPVGRGSGDEIKAQTSDFNNAFYTSKRLKVTSNLIDRANEVVLIKSFRNSEEGMGYFDVFTSNREDLIEINSSGYDIVLISNENYVTLFKNKDIQGYVKFFAQHYLSGK